MGTRNQVNEIYYTRMQALLNKINKDKQAQIDKDVEAARKRDEKYGKISMGLTVANLAKDLRESAMMEMSRVGERGEFGYKYIGEGEDVTAVPIKKYQTRDVADRGWLPEGLLPFGKKPKLGKIGAKVLAPLEKTEGYKEFKAKEDAPVEVVEEVTAEVAPLTLSTGKIVKDPSAEFDADAIREALKTAESGSQEKFELTQQLEYIETFSPEELEEIKLKESERLLLLEEESAERFYEEDPITGEPLTAPGEISPTDYTVASPDQQLQLRRKQAGVDLEQLITEAEALEMEKQGLSFNPMTEEWEPIPRPPVPSTDIPGTTVQTEREMWEAGDIQRTDIQEWESDLEIGEGVFTAEELENMAGSVAITLPTKPPVLQPTIPHMSQEQKAILELERKTMPSVVSMQELEGKLPPKPLSFKEQTLPKTLTAEPTALDRTKRIKDFVDPMSEEFDPTQITPTKGIPAHVPMASGAEGAPIAPEIEIPDAKSGIGKVAGSAFQAGQTAMQLTSLGNTLRSKDTTDEEKGIATVQGTQILADLAAKKAGQQTASQLGKKAAGRFIAKEGLEEGIKLTGKQAVGTVAGGVLGAHTMVTEAGEAKESWEEEDYDEAILHGMGSVSGGFQTAGAGLMLTGNPLGAVLYGIGTAGSLASSVGLFLEDMFEKEEEPEKQKFNVSQYLNTIRQRDSY